MRELLRGKVADSLALSQFGKEPGFATTTTIYCDSSQGDTLQDADHKIAGHCLRDNYK
jgi:hypothetical protein